VFLILNSEGRKNGMVQGRGLFEAGRRVEEEDEKQRERQTSRAATWPTNPPATFSAVPSGRRPKPLICVWAAVRFSRELPFTSLICTIFFFFFFSFPDVLQVDQVRSQ
jgi:hypothetical protein